MAFRYPIRIDPANENKVSNAGKRTSIAIAATVARLRLDLEEWERSRSEQWRIASTRNDGGSAGIVLHLRACATRALRDAEKLRVKLVERKRQRLSQLLVCQHAVRKREILRGCAIGKKENYAAKLIAANSTGG